MSEISWQDAETRRAWTQDEVSGHIEGFGQVMRGVHGDTSESSGDTDLADLDASTDVYDDVSPPSACGSTATSASSAQKPHP